PVLLAWRINPAGGAPVKGMADSFLAPLGPSTQRTGAPIGGRYVPRYCLVHRPSSRSTASRRIGPAGAPERPFRASKEQHPMARGRTPVHPPTARGFTAVGARGGPPRRPP